jgi:hypothetical protein
MLTCEASRVPAKTARQLGRFFDSVLPALQGQWLCHSHALTHLESLGDPLPDDCEIGCGPTAFAALGGVPLGELKAYFPELERRPWINRKEMECALQGFGWNFVKTDSSWPNLGLCFIHWCGPWTDRGYAHSILQRTHWVAVIGEYVFDINWRGWLPKENWEDVVVPDLLQNHSRANGWKPLTAYEVCFR